MAPPQGPGSHFFGMPEIPQWEKGVLCASGIISKNTFRFHSTHELN